MVKMLANPVGRELNAIFLPSGDHRGCPLSSAFIKVSWRHWDPSLAQVQISTAPDRFDWNAIRVPSGAYCGFISSSLEAMSGPTRGAERASKSMAQISGSFL